jgi:transposase
VRSRHVLSPHCCGLDIHKKTIVACVLLTDADGAPGRFVRTFGTMTADLLALGDWLQFPGVTHVAMERTGVLWRPVFNVLEEEGRTLILVNAQHIKALPGRKTDVKESEWLADLLRHGLLTASFLPPPPIRMLRDLTRYRKSLVELRTQAINRIHKVLETANLKLGAVASNVVGVRGRRMLRAIEQGESDPAILAELAKGRLREQLSALRQALAGRVHPHQRLLVGELLDHLAYLEQAIQRMEGRIATLLDEHEATVQLLLTLPATGPVTAAAIIAELGADMARFPSAAHLAIWPSGLVGRGLSREQAQCWQTAQWRDHQGQHPAEDHPVRDCGDHCSLARRLPARVLSPYRAPTRHTTSHAGRRSPSVSQHLSHAARSGALPGLGTRPL